MMCRFDFNQYRNVTIEDRSVLEPLLLASEPMTCESNFLNIYVWQHIYSTKYQIFRGRPYVYLEEEDELLFPAGANGDYEEPEILFEVSSVMKSHGKNGNIYQVRADYLEKFPMYADYFNAVQIHEDYGEYIYRVEDLVELHGSKLHKKKNLISQFQRLYPEYRVVPFTMDRLDDCRALCGMWRKLKAGTGHEEGIVEEHEAIDRAFAQFGRLSMEGCCLYVGEKLVAFAVCSRVNSEMYTVHFEKNDPDYKGSGQVINQETARSLLGKALYINREQDLGVEGLRHAKSSYAPVELLRNYNLIPKTGV